MMLIMPIVLLPSTAVLGVQTDSGNVNISGSVSTPPPTFKPTIISPQPGETSMQKITVEGTCSPNTLVKIFRNNIFAGSVYCSATGRFSLVITLFSGRNDLKAVNYDINDQAGPESDVVNVIYKPAADVAISNILLEANYTLRQVSTDEEVFWTLTINGGKPPYELNIDWGDGTLEQQTQDIVGQRIISHTYKKSGKYAIVVTVKDSLKTSTILQLSVMVIGRIAGPESIGSVALCKQNASNFFENIRCNISPVVLNVILPIYWSFIGILLIAWLINKIRNSRHAQGGKPYYGRS